MKKSIPSPNVAETSPIRCQSNFSRPTDNQSARNIKKVSVPGTILGLDFGEAKIGVAIADEETRMAFAFDTFANDGEFLKNLEEIIRCENVKMMVVGVPTFKVNDEIHAAKKFGERIAKATRVKVEYEEEMFTTKMAQDNIKKRGGRNIAASDDQEAARIILQSWLDKAAS